METTETWPGPSAKSVGELLVSTLAIGEGIRQVVRSFEQLLHWGGHLALFHTGLNF